ncbi:DUF2505 domain-containing protein [Saccharopolyspora sp. WRP15-2]|uniref:DUF2505 domain-containing protein n=1 Tax=Saccharopolyspora oryzae TaxID=2997343 RepID=A0ABT4V254_9PSEU|nr:DUF2505 domain-containing protein [Saccharopolyspora oryzae]MDA3628046.1 DUF2505 domain-containing protein [Saccharopolyspora oryzae]
MARRIEHRSTSEWPAVRLYEALIDIDYLNDRLEELGGANAELVKHLASDGGAQFQIRHSVSADSLPSVARTVVGGDLTIDRSESWRREEDGHYTGEIAAEIAGAPCTITGSMWLRDVAGEASTSEFVVSGSVRVNVPFVGGKIEDLVADQVQKFLSAEERFTTEWLARRG